LLVLIVVDKAEASIAACAALDGAGADLAGDAEEEGADAAFAAVLGEGVVGGEEGFLDELLGLGLGADEGHAEAAQGGAVGSGAAGQGVTELAPLDGSFDAGGDGSRFGGVTIG
jgi:hypothetical protein